MQSMRFRGNILWNRILKWKERLHRQRCRILFAIFLEIEYLLILAAIMFISITMRVLFPTYVFLPHISFFLSTIGCVSVSIVVKYKLLKISKKISKEMKKGL